MLMRTAWEEELEDDEGAEREREEGGEGGMRPTWPPQVGMGTLICVFCLL